MNSELSLNLWRPRSVIFCALAILAMVSTASAQSGGRAPGSGGGGPGSLGGISSAASSRAAAARSRPAAAAGGSGTRSGGSGTRSAGSATRSAGSTTRSAGSSSRSRGPISGGALTLRANPIVVPPSGSSRSAAPRSSLAGGLPSLRSPFSASQAPRSLIPLTTSTPSQYLQRNGASFPTGHSTGSQFYSHYYQR